MPSIIFKKKDESYINFISWLAVLNWNFYSPNDHFAISQVIGVEKKVCEHIFNNQVQLIEKYKDKKEVMEFCEAWKEKQKIIENQQLRRL